MSNNKSKVFRVYHELCRKYLCEANKDLFNHICDSKMYLEIAEINKACSELHGAKAKPQKPAIVINNEALYKMYFNS